MTSESRRNRNRLTGERNYPGEDEAGFLLDLINPGRDGQDAWQQRPGHMIDRESLKRLVIALQAAGQVRPVTIKRWESRDASVKTEAERLKTVNAILHRYEAVPTVQPSRTGGVRIVWRSTGENATSKGQTRGVASSELHGALLAVSLAERSLIGRLKQCANCSRWFFQRFEHQKFHSQACKNLFYRDHPAEKERRRVWARENYRSRVTVETGSSRSKKVK